MCCERMEDGKTKSLSTKIKRHYTIFCIYVLNCQALYTGWTTQTVQKRHYGHRSEMKHCEEGMGAHFHDHSVQMGIDLNSQMDEIIKYCRLTIVGSVEPGGPGSRTTLDKLEADIQNRLMTMERHRGHELEGRNWEGQRTCAVSP